MIVQILQALIAIPQIAGYVKDAISAVVLWYLSNQSSATMVQIADAAALSVHAENEEDRYAAAQKWRDALSRPRISI